MDPVRLVFDVPSDVSAIEPLIADLVVQCERFRFGGPRVSLNLRVAVSEALANAVLYGNRSDPSKTVRVEVALDDQAIALRIEDEGVGFDAAPRGDPATVPGVEQTNGRGIFLMRKLMDEVEFLDRGNVVRLVLYREPRSLSGPATP